MRAKADVLLGGPMMSENAAHKAMKVSAAMGGRPGRWVCSCGKSKTDAGWHQVWMVRLSWKEHVDGKS